MSASGLACLNGASDFVRWQRWIMGVHINAHLLVDTTPMLVYLKTNAVSALKMDVTHWSEVSLDAAYCELSSKGIYRPLAVDDYDPDEHAFDDLFLSACATAALHISRSAVVKSKQEDYVKAAATFTQVLDECAVRHRSVMQIEARSVVWSAVAASLGRAYSPILSTIKSGDVPALLEQIYARKAFDGYVGQCERESKGCQQVCINKQKQQFCKQEAGIW